ncbi:hypothetical protein AYO38_08805 [bacterium SCGC AG-212-C10]|nr:hypothetical protein AYO38_08805 [bacterium SCGC AG-212-C10]
MCFKYDASPAITPIAGAAVDSEDLVLKSADGTEFAAFVARAEAPNGAGMVVLPDVRGLFRFYEELALRFAETGVNSVAIDYFGRTAGVAKRGEDFAFMPEVMKTKIGQITDDTRAAVEYLRSTAGGSCTSIFTVGFCFGGSNSWLQAAGGHDLAGAIGFYGRPANGFADNAPGPAARAGEMKAPILALFGGADAMIPPDQIEEFDKALTAADVEHEIKSYEGAPHSFFDRTYEEFAKESADAWERIQAFIAKHKK